MKLVKILFTSILLYTICGIPLLHASSINPAIERISLSQGERKYGSVLFTNSEDKDIEVLITPYSYNPKTDDISEDKRLIFLKVDTDTIKVKANSSFNIKYEIYPLNNLELGTYYNIIAITPTESNQNVRVNLSISQLIILDIVDATDQVRGVATDQYSAIIDVKRRGIPFITPLTLEYSIKNNSNFLLVPEGRIDIFNEKNSYKPTYVYINEYKEKVYPGETLEKEIKIEKWYIADLFIKRVAYAQVYNGIDKNVLEVETEINSYIFELSLFFVAIIVGILLGKSLKEDFKKKGNK